MGSDDLLVSLVGEASRTDCVSCSSLVPLGRPWAQPHGGCPVGCQGLVC